MKRGKILISLNVFLSMVKFPLQFANIATGYISYLPIALKPFLYVNHSLDKMSFFISSKAKKTMKKLIQIYFTLSKVKLLILMLSMAWMLNCFLTEISINFYFKMLIKYHQLHYTWFLESKLVLLCVENHHIQGCQSHMSLTK